MSRDDDLFLKLACAVYAGDLASAEEALSLMYHGGFSERRTELIARARREHRPLPELPGLRERLALPAPGADPHDYFGGPGRRGRFGGFKAGNRP